MSKTTVTRLFIGGGIAVIAGAILGIATVWVASANEVFLLNGPDIVGLQASPLTWVLLGTGLVSGLAMAGGLIAGFVAWIGALLSTWRLERRAWFVGLLLLGLFNLGFFAMIAFILAGPDERADAAIPNPSPTATVA